MLTRHRVSFDLPTDNGSNSDEMRVGRDIYARFRKLSDRKGVIHLWKLLVVAALAYYTVSTYYTMFNYGHNFHSQLGGYLYLITPPSSSDDMEENQSSHYAKFGEVSEEMLGLIPTGINIMPINSTWERVSWMNRKSFLHGNYPKMICHLFGDNQTAPIRSQPLSENSLPYRVLVRPINLHEGENDGVGNEFLAYNVAQELSIQKIPTQTIIASDPSPEKAPMNIQSLLRGVHMTYMDDWTNCLPNTTALDDSFSTKPPSRVSDNGVVLDIGKGKWSNETRMIRLNFVHANTEAVWKLCFRNATHFNTHWGEYCLQHQPLIRKCRQEEIAQLLEMAMFDAIIFNRDRMRMGSMSNNVHWLWPSGQGDGSEPPVNTEDPLQLVWIDHAHSSFTDAHPSGGLVDYFNEMCVFPDNLLQQLFHPIARSDHRSLSERVLERLMPKLSAVFNETEGSQSTEERAQAAAQKLKVVDLQLERLRAVVAKCAKKHNPQGAVDVIEDLNVYGSR